MRQVLSTLVWMILPCVLLTVCEVPQTALRFPNTVLRNLQMAILPDVKVLSNLGNACSGREHIVTREHFVFTEKSIMTSSLWQLFAGSFSLLPFSENYYAKYFCDQKNYRR